MSSLVKNQSSSSTLPLPCLRFSFEEIKTATNDFLNEISELSHYGGDVYRGNISGNTYSGDVFVIRLYKWYKDSPVMFENQIKALTACHHNNIIALVGFCDEKDKNVLVYEFMPNGSLSNYLYRHEDTTPRLTVEQRLEICLGVAKGLCYLHSGADFNVVHHYICAFHILLDDSLVPKISGFTHAKTRVVGPASSQEITTNRLEEVNLYYSPPECHEPGYKVSRKADIYAFGVVLLEVLSERSPVYELLAVALPSIMEGELPKFTPQLVKENITPTCERRCAKLIMDCLEFQPDKRPCMNQVVQDLELALKLQQNQQINFKEQSSGENNRCQSFSLVEIERAKNESSTPLGKGGFGEVYRGNISSNGNNVDVAMKFLSTNLEQGIPSFEIEKKLLPACDHENIISLVGYCDENDQKILVYEFMPNGSLFDYLYKPKDGTPRLTVEQRLEICLGVAKGLSYLHSRDDYNIIHSDLKTDNILLDANLVPKISDFGLSRSRVVGPSTSAQVTKHIQGTEGYIAPECYEPNYKLSRKADVYAFGVVLLEVLCEKPGWMRLVVWALPFLSKGELPKFTPKHVVKYISLECSRACASLIRDCLDNDPNNRPSMSHVIAHLDLILTLQKMNVDGNNQKNKSQANINGHQRFSLSDIETATNKFSHQNLVKKYDTWANPLGEKVYRGKVSIDVVMKLRTAKADHVIDLFKNKFGLKNADRSSLPKNREKYFPHEIDLYENEIDTLSTCHHSNIISLVGYCDEPNDKILIYEFMPNGSLYDHLHSKPDSGVVHLTVEQRLEICLGVAKGLSYLHSTNIIHCNLNSKNILLDCNFVAKISNFEFSTRCAAGQSTSQKFKHTKPGNTMSQAMAPECGLYDYVNVSQEAEVYAFGVMFLEVLCERPSSRNLITTALQVIMRGELDILTPEHVRTCISRKCAQACENIIRDCLETDPDKRPSVNQVVEKLELALKLQKEGANY